MSSLTLITMVGLSSPFSRDWVLHHLNLGVGRIVAYVPPEKDFRYLEEFGARIILVPIDEKLRKSWELSPRFQEIKIYLDSYPFISESLNIEHCLSQETFGKDDWYLYLGTYEWLRLDPSVSSINGLLSSYSDYNQIIVNNFERLPGDTLLKKNPVVVSNNQLTLFRNEFSEKPFYFFNSPHGRTLFRPGLINSNIPRSVHAFHTDPEQTLEASYFDLLIISEVPSTFENFLSILAKGPGEYEIMAGANGSFYSIARKIYEVQGESSLEKWFQQNVLYSESQKVRLNELKLLLKV
jgi:hypothetical protein